MPAHVERSSRASDVLFSKASLDPAGEEDDGPGLQEWLEKIGDFVSQPQ